MRLLWVFSHPAPYKREFFSLLGEHVDLTAVFENEREGGRHPGFYQAKGEHYVEKLLPQHGKGKALLKEMREGSYDLVVMNGWAQPQEGSLPFPHQRRKDQGTGELPQEGSQEKVHPQPLRDLPFSRPHLLGIPEALRREGHPRPGIRI